MSVPMIDGRVQRMKDFTVSFTESEIRARIRPAGFFQSRGVANGDVA